MRKAVISSSTLGLMYFSSDLSGGGLYAVPLEATGERKPIEIARSTSQLQGPRVSADGRYVSYVF